MYFLDNPRTYGKQSVGIYTVPSKNNNKIMPCSNVKHLLEGIY